MLREKIKETNVSSSKIWQVSNTMPLCKVLSLSACARLCKMARKKVDNFPTKKELYQFQIECVSYLNLKQSKELKEKFYKCLFQKFDFRTSHHMRKILKQENTRIIDVIILYENRESLIFKVLGVLVYF